MIGIKSSYKFAGLLKALIKLRMGLESIDYKIINILFISTI